MIFFHKTTVSFLTISLICLTLVSCTSNEPKPDTTSISIQEKKTVYKDLSSKYKQLFKQNLELKKTLQKLEEEKQAEKEKSDNTIKNLSNTIKLLELNLTQMNSRLNDNSAQLNQLSTIMTKPVPLSTVENQSPKEKIELPPINPGLSRDFKTPDNSRAINSVPLLPNSNLSEEELQSDVADESPLQVKEEKDAENADSVFLIKRPDSAWHDPDLNTPTSPIQLKVIPGAKKSYQEAFKAFSNRDFNNAIKLFSDFLKRFPSDLDADNSQYWIGQSHYQLEDFINAEHAFRKVLRNYQHSETKRGYKTPDAILMLGRIYSNRNQPVKGRYYYEEVIKRFPDSRSAAKAKREVQSMSVF